MVKRNYEDAQQDKLDRGTDTVWMQEKYIVGRNEGVRNPETGNVITRQDLLDILFLDIIQQTYLKSPGKMCVSTT